MMAENFKENHRNTPPQPRPKIHHETEGGYCGGFELNEAGSYCEKLRTIKKEYSFYNLNSVKNVDAEESKKTNAHPYCSDVGKYKTIFLCEV
jgi:hypothetical protein